MTASVSSADERFGGGHARLAIVGSGMTHEVVTSPDLPPALGPYSPVIRAGNLLFVSAQTGVDPDTGQMPDGGFEAECRQALTNLQQALRAADADLANVVKTTVFYTSLDDLPTLNTVYAETFPAPLTHPGVS